MLQNAVSLAVNGHIVTIRPIRLTDAAMEADFIRRLSALTKRYRFFGAVKELPAAEITQLCTIDGHESMALVATVEESGRTVEIGVCRFAPAPSADNAAREMALTIADTWQKTDLARVLMQHLIEYAQQAGVHQLSTVELSDNQSMRELANAFGMSAMRDPGNATQVIYSLAI